MEVRETSENLESGIHHDKQPLITIKRIKILQPAELAAEGNLNELTKAIDLSQIDHNMNLGLLFFTMLQKILNRLEVIEYFVSSGCDILMRLMMMMMNKLLFTNLQCLVMQKLLSCWLVKEQMLIRLTTMATPHFM